MNTRLLLPLLGLGLFTLTPAMVRGQAETQESKPEKKAAAEAAAEPTPEDFSKYKTADEFWARIEELKKGPTERPNSRKAFTAYLKNMAGAAEEFGKRFPDDKRRWDAKLIGVELSGVMAQIQGEKPDPKKMESAFKEIAAAPDATEEAKSEARLGLLQIHLATSEDKLTPELDSEIAAFQKDFPDNEHNGELQLYRVKLMEKSDPAKAETLLAELAKSPNQEVSRQAQGQLQQREVTKKPLDLKFTAVDGKEVDLSKLRGKVVLVDFWATWCGPCMAEVPNVVKTYNKLHDKGFEIVGISLDQSKDNLLKVTKEKGMTWPQYFDGKGWKNTISTTYGIDSIPRMWLVNKKGMVVSTEARENLEGEVEKLLAE
jgi:thiol-disulfide isomerase/thioredoxin